MRIELTGRGFFNSIGADNFLMLFRDETMKYPFLREWVNEGSSLRTIIIIDSRGEYRAFCEALKGQYVTIDEQTPCGLDPLRVGAMWKNWDEDTQVDYVSAVVRLLLASLETSVNKEDLVEMLTILLVRYLQIQTEPNFEDWIKSFPFTLWEKIRKDPGLKQWRAWTQSADLLGRRTQDNMLRGMDLSQLKDPTLWLSLFVLKSYTGFPFEKEDGSNLVFFFCLDDWAGQNAKAKQYLEAIKGFADLECDETSYGFIESTHHEGESQFRALFDSAEHYEIRSFQNLIGERVGVFSRESGFTKDPLNFVLIKDLAPMSCMTHVEPGAKVCSDKALQEVNVHDKNYEPWVREKLEQNEPEEYANDWHNKPINPAEQKLPLLWRGFIVATFLIATFALGIGAWLPGAIRGTPVRVVDLVQLSLDAAKVYPTEAEEDEALGVVFDRLKALQEGGTLILNAQQVMAAPDSMMLKSEALLPERETLKAYEADDNRQAQDAAR